MKKQLLAVVALGASIAQASALELNVFSSLSQDNDVDRYFFSLSHPSSVRVFTSSWDDGGFDPVVALWDGTGNLLAEWDDSGLTGSVGTLSYGSWDVFEEFSLPAGDYSVTIAQFNNFAVAALGENITLGFQWDGSPNFTLTELFGLMPNFNGVNGTYDAINLTYNDPRTGNYGLHIMTPDAGSTAGLLALGAAAVLAVRRRR